MRLQVKIEKIILTNFVSCTCWAVHDKQNTFLLHSFTEPQITPAYLSLKNQIRSKMGSKYIVSWYINPHLFWLRSIESSNEFIHFEHQLDNYYKLNCSTPADYVPHLGEVSNSLVDYLRGLFIWFSFPDRSLPGSPRIQMVSGSCRLHLWGLFVHFVVGRLRLRRARVQKVCPTSQDEISWSTVIW